MVISGGNFKPDTLKPKEVVSLLLDDEEIELKYRVREEPCTEPSTSQAAAAAAAAATGAISSSTPNEKRRRNPNKSAIISAASTPGGITIPAATFISSSQEDANSSLQNSPASKRFKLEAQLDDDSIDVGAGTSERSSPSVATISTSEPFVPGATTIQQHDDSDPEALVVDCEDSPLHGSESPTTLFGDYGSMARIRRRHHPRGTKRGRPRGIRRGGGVGSGTLSRSLSSPVGGGGASGLTSTPTPVSGEDAALNQSQPLLPSEESAAGAFAPNVPTPIKRGPGRPRLKTGGPPNQGARGARARKPTGGPLLVVPLGQSPVLSATSPAHLERSNQSATAASVGVADIASAADTFEI